jgi:uncharacterized protein YjbI with pentapeptide repeats
VALGRTRIPAGARIVVALVVFAILLLATTYMLWPNFLGAVTATTTTTTHFTYKEGERRVKEKEETIERQNLTFWHVVGAVGIPVLGGLLIVWVGSLFNRNQREREEAVENKQAQDSALQAYLDQMSNLLVNQHLRSLPPGSDIHRLAEARTSEVLLGLDGERKRRPLKLVYGLELIKKKGTNTGEKDGTLLDLQNLSLDHADLTELTLRKASLRSADLRGADLQGADLSGSDLSYADLRGANLTNADLSHADLSGANLLPYNEEDPATLSLHNLKDHALPTDKVLHSLAEQQEEQRLAKLKHLQSHISRRLRRPLDRLVPAKPVTFTDLTDTKLEGASLTGAILANADLREVRGLTQEQVDSAIGNDKTHLPDGLNPPPNDTWKEKRIEDQVKKFEAQMKVRHNE